MNLAVLGGKPIVPKGSFCDWPNVTEEEVKSLVEKFKSISFNNYKLDYDITQFEELFGKYIGTKYCFTLNSGTAAIYSALVGCNLKPSDNVIVPAYSFFSAAAAVLNAGAKVKFCDVDLQTFNIDSQSFKEQIDEDTKAVILVHIFGNPCNIDKINQICKEKEIIIIEDACQAHGAMYKRKKTGNLGDIAAFSFHISKNLPIVEGGAITTNNVKLRDKAASANMFPNYIENKHINLGNNFKFNGLFAKIGLERLKSLEKFNNRRQENRDYLIQRLKKFDFIIPQKITENAQSSNAMFVFRIDHSKLNISNSLIDSRNRFLLALHKEGVNCGIWSDKIVPEMEMFGIDASKFPNAKMLVDSTIYISGIHYPNSKNEMNLIIKAIEKIVDNKEELKEIK
ncbi:MAG: aminotransferase class V-fold PLP-dependent enzyme [Nanoarchaeota archaeon]|nr:aminotransferase class V-fold PLP-dependent enzyme [Nanoarchaeota archaeon]MBU1632536.1 aminotransferase class V-fold PLP-dependent enzyme [Nanoarchaeota archaeon]MBU1875692.1 aminotransferase class V-fold PLP-dependent enzyme [Nanoarchaeota archaeon]